MIDANATKSASLYAQNAALDSALDRCQPRVVATYVVVELGEESYPVITVLDDGTEVTELRTRRVVAHRRVA